MSKRFTNFIIILLPILLAVTFVIWFAIGMSPGGNFSKGRITEETKTFPQAIKDSVLHSTLTYYATELNKMDVSSLKKISTEKGYTSLLNWSDSLKNKAFFSDLSEMLSKFEVFNMVDYDSIITLSLGESHDVLGATGGYLFLKKVNSELKIDQFRGGK